MGHAHTFFVLVDLSLRIRFRMRDTQKYEKQKRAKQEEEEAQAEEIVKFVCIDIDSVRLSCFYTIHTIHVVMYTYDLLGYKDNSQPKQPSVEKRKKKSLKERFFFLRNCSICVYEYERIFLLLLASL